MPYKDVEKRKLNNRNRYWYRKQNNLCVYCGREALLGIIYCPDCLIRHELSDRKCYRAHSEERRIQADSERERRKAENRCIRCGAPLIEGETGYCFNCLIFRHEGMIKGVLSEVNHETTTIKS